MNDDCPEVRERSFPFAPLRASAHCAQDDSAGSCHPERSEGSVVCIRLADLTQVALRTYGESPEERYIHEGEFPKRHPSIP